jgi:phosphatidylserine/phosphatidylglycerophosphate/cardiolipin synthase-like enzyme
MKEVLMNKRSKITFRRIMNRGILSIALLILFFTFSSLKAQTFNQIELVESIPIETSLDNPDIRNTTTVWSEMINGAHSTIDIEQFYIANQSGESLDTIINEIIKASERGVIIRIISDSRMYKTYPETIDKLNKQKNISARIIDFRKTAGGIQHAKYFIVDGGEIFLGSQNFDWRALKHIHELGIRIHNKQLASIYQDIFELDWKIAEPNHEYNLQTDIKFKKYSHPIILIDSSHDTIPMVPTMSPISVIPDSSLWDETWIVKMIDEAKNEILCQFLTYSPLARDKIYYSVLDNALRRAAVRGVKVKMAVSDWSKDHPTIDFLKSLSLIPNIEIKFISIPDWSGGYVSYARVDHCKFLVVDSTQCWIGTSNWEKNYFYNSRNLGLCIFNQSIAKQIAHIFFSTWNTSYTELIKPEIEYKERKHGD